MKEAAVVRRATGTVPEQKEAGLIAKRMREWEEEYFRFIEAGIEATNNPAELTIRQSVLDRVVTQGSRDVARNEWHERFWSVVTTCGMQEIPVVNCLKELSKLGDPLERLNTYIDWEQFRKTLTGALQKEPKGPGGRPPFDYVMMFKILILDFGGKTGPLPVFPRACSKTVRI
jgi:hypothetical protein